MDNLSLIGFMGAGKSAVGSALSIRTGRRFIDLDEVIEAVEGEKIFNIIKNRGEDHFRHIESVVIKKIYYNDGCVFACGGGAIERAENIKIIRNRSTVIYLYISPQTALKRLIDDDNRPLLDVEDRKNQILRLLSIRELKYRKAADIVVDNNAGIQDTIEEIIKKI